MSTSETIAYAIKKKCREDSLFEWCKSWGFTIEQFERFLQAGVDGCRIDKEGEA